MISDAFDTSLLQQWVGNTETAQARVGAQAAGALAATLDRPIAFAPGAALPPLWHWLYFLPRRRQAEIGPDGHPQRGGFLPPVPLPRRMWAGGRLAFQRAAARRRRDRRAPRASPTSTPRKARSGDAGVRHGAPRDRATRAALALTEEHDIVYRDAAAAGRSRAARRSRRRPTRAWRAQIVPDPVLLFRYSALTFNGHRIHYDRSYVTEVEGYPGLIVHGPLIATLLVDLLRRQLPDARVQQLSASRRCGPLFDIAPVHRLRPPRRRRQDRARSGRATTKAGWRWRPAPTLA